MTLEELKTKNKESMESVKRLNDIIQLHGKKPLAREKTAKITELYDRMEYRLLELKEQTIGKEFDIKREIYQNVVDILTT